MVNIIAQSQATTKEIMGGAPDQYTIKRWEWGLNQSGGTEYGLVKSINETPEMRKQFKSDLNKALTTTLNTYSAGTLPVLVPIYVDPEIVDVTRRATPLVELISRITNYGNYASYNLITKIETAQLIPEDGALVDQNDTYVRRTIPVRVLASKGRVTEVMIEASRPYLSSGGYVDAMSLEVRTKTLSLRRLEEATILLGDSVTNWVEPVNSTTMPAAYSFDGLWNMISNANSNGNGGSSTYATDLAAATLSIDNIRSGIRLARTRGGEPNLIVCDYATYDQIKKLIQDQLRYVSTLNIAWGITTLSFEGIPIIASRFLSTVAGDNSSNNTPYKSKSLFIIDTNIVEMRVLRDVTYEELAQNNLSKQFVVSAFETLVVKAPQFCQVIYDYA